MAFVEGFPPVARHDARVLVLGSMPGAASLAAGRYYAHPRNAFWPIAGALFGFGADAPYDERLAGLTAAGVALWDVLAACERPGSLDAAIDRATARTNDFVAFFAAHPRLSAVACNGGAAHELFRRRVLPRLAAAGGIEVGQQRADRREDQTERQSDHCARHDEFEEVVAEREHRRACGTEHHARHDQSLGMAAVGQWREEQVSEESSDEAHTGDESEPRFAKAVGVLQVAERCEDDTVRRGDGERRRNEQYRVAPDGLGGKRRLDVGHGRAAARTSAPNAGHASRAHGPNSRSVSARQATLATGSTQRNVPVPPKCPKVDRLARSGIQ
jgi:hypoxanthine-DNA glycosylase